MQIHSVATLLGTPVIQCIDSHYIFMLRYVCIMTYIKDLFESCPFSEMFSILYIQLPVKILATFSTLVLVSLYLRYCDMLLRHFLVDHQDSVDQVGQQKLVS